MSFKPLIKLTGHNSSVYNLIDSGDEVFYSCGGEGYIVAWQKSGKEENGLLIAQCGNAVYCGCSISKYNILVVGTLQGNVIWIDLAAKATLHTSMAHTKSIYDLKMYGDVLLSGGGDGKLIWHDVQQMKPYMALQVCNSALRSICIDEKQGLLYVGASDSHLYVIDAKQKKVLSRHQLHDSSIFTLLLIDGILYSGSRDAKIKLWSAADMHHIKSIDAHKSTINSLAYMSDLIISASKDKSIKIWSKDGILIQSIYAVEGGHINSVNKVLAFEKMDRFVTASDDRIIGMYSIV